MLTLAITSSTAVVGVAVGPAGGPVLAASEVATDRRHAEELTPMIGRVLGAAEATVADLDAIAIDVGPGRFTGLRVGLTTARSLALAVDIGVIGLTSLEILAAGEASRPVVAVVDARRGEVFQQRFDAAPVRAPGARAGGTSSGVGGGSVDRWVITPLEAAGPPAVGAPDELARAAGGATVVGDGADRYREHYGSRVVEGRSPSATVMVALAAGRALRPGPEVVPVYLREPDVQINVTTRHSPR